MAAIPLLHRLSLRPTAAATTTFRHRETPSLHYQHPLTNPLRIPPLKLPNKTLTPKFTMSATTPATDRLISAVGYFLPFLNGLHYGRFLFTQYPSLALLFQPFLPLFSLYKSIPYASFVAFFALYLGIVRNPSFSQYVRFNAMQAVVLDVLLVVPLLLLRIFTPGRDGLGLKLMVMGHNALFVFVVFCFVYGVVCSVLGKTPYLPFVADAAGRQL